MGVMKKGDEIAARMSANVGRYADKVPDWDAFPGSRGHPELARSQIRYIGAGGSPKVDDPSTLEPEHFTVSMVASRSASTALRTRTRWRRRSWCSKAC